MSMIIAIMGRRMVMVTMMKVTMLMTVSNYFLYQLKDFSIRNEQLLIKR